jgi:hypothetical protein
MSLVSKITARNENDLINEGASRTITGSSGGSVTDDVLQDVSAERAIVVTGLSLTTDAASPVAVTLGFKKDTDPTMTFWEGKISKEGPVSRDYAKENWKRGGLDYDLVITADGDVTVTADVKITSFPAELGFIERWGAQSATAHPGRAVLPEESGADRGQSEV